MVNVVFESVSICAEYFSFFRQLNTLVVT
jgi:hypothetical protein